MPTLPEALRQREHLAWANSGTHIVGLTATGRATGRALRLDNEYVVEARALWIARQWHPPIEQLELLQSPVAR